MTAGRGSGWFRPLHLALKALGVVIGGALGVAVAWALGFLWFAANLPDRVADPSTRTDAVVVLTGGSERLTTGVHLLQSGAAGKLFISGVHKDVDMVQIARVTNAAPEMVACCIALGHSANDTVGNAAETALWARAEGLASIRLVTGAYHMPRSLLEFRRALPGSVLVPHPVFPDAVKSDEWWRWRGTAVLLATEYSKYVAAEIRHWFLPRKETLR